MIFSFVRSFVSSFSFGFSFLSRKILSLKLDLILGTLTKGIPPEAPSFDGFHVGHITGDSFYQ